MPNATQIKWLQVDFEEIKNVGRSRPVTKADQQLLNTIADRVELEKKLSQNLDYLQALALKEVIAESEADNNAARLLLDRVCGSRSVGTAKAKIERIGMDRVTGLRGGTAVT